MPFCILYREVLEEDKDGLLDTAIADIIEKSRRRRLEERRAAGKVRLGIMRHLYVVLDLSQSMMDQDLKPNRLYACFKVNHLEHVMSLRVCLTMHPAKIHSITISYPIANMLSYCNF